MGDLELLLALNGEDLEPGGGGGDTVPGLA